MRGIIIRLKHQPYTMPKAMYRTFIAFTLGLFVLLMGACRTTDKVVYFKDAALQDPTIQTQRIDRFKEAIVQPDDILAINVSTYSSIVDQTPVNLFEGGTPVAITATLGGGAGGTSRGYLVDPSGFIDFPVVGKVKVGSMTLRQIKETLSLRLKDYVKQPVVDARIINYRVTILGEVGRPGTIVAPNQKISIIDALAAAGDVPITGRKDNILVIRETEGTREMARLNLNSREVFNSPYFYLKQNDVVYVEPSKLRKQEGNEFLRFYLPAISALLSTAIALYSISRINN